MNPVSSNTDPTTTTGCSSLVSSNCVTWEGTLASCISVCDNPSLTEVITSISTIACANASDIFTLQQTVESLQSQIDACDCTGGGGGSVDTTITLVSCLTDNCEGCAPGTEYPLQTGLDTAFGILCSMIDTVQTNVDNLDYPSLIIVNELIATSASTTLLAAQNYTNTQIATLSGNTVTVGINGLLGPTPGAVVSTSTALTYFSNQVASHHSIVGSTAQLQSAIARQDTNLYNEAALDPAEAGNSLNDIGVTTFGATLSESVSNIWITLQDLRLGFVDLVNNPTTSCALIPVKDLEIQSTTTSSCVVTYTAHGLTTIETETSFTAEIFAYNGVQATGPVLATGTANASGATFSNLDTNINITAGTDYVIRITSNYSCGTAVKEIVGNVKSCGTLYYVHLTRTYNTAADTCNSVGYTKKFNYYNVTLRSSSNPTSTIINNLTGSTITVSIKVPLYSPSVSSQPLYELYDFVIAPNTNTVTRIDVPETYQKINDPTCDEVYRDEDAVLAFGAGIDSLEWNPDYTVPCYISLVTIP